MNLDALAETIATLKKRIDQHRQELSENETRTRAALINPLLHALGWDVSDPALVKLEYNVGKQRADYALMKPDGKPAAVLEAKKLGESLDDHQIQTLNYANREGVAYGGLTDGNRWELYSVFEQAPLKERRRVYISIVDDPPYECALELLALWRLNLASGKVKKANAPIIVDDEEETSRPDPEPTPDPPTEPPVNGEWVTLSEYHPPGGTVHPSAIRFSDNDEVKLYHWCDISIECAKWLNSNGHLTRANMPVLSSSGKSFVANSEPKTRSGKRMIRAEEIADGVYVSRHGEIERYLKRTVSLLQHCGVDPSEVHLKTADVDEGK